jgi:hypothetical protein
MPRKIPLEVRFSWIRLVRLPRCLDQTAPFERFRPSYIGATDRSGKLVSDGLWGCVTRGEICEFIPWPCCLWQRA